MPKIIVKRKSTFIDMTAMSDVTVLLLTFFMLTSTFIQKEPVVVTTPASVSEIKIPETNILSILVDPEGKVFMSMDKQEDKANVLKKLGQDYGINFSDKEIYEFSLLRCSYPEYAGISESSVFRTGPSDAELRNPCR